MAIPWNIGESASPLFFQDKHSAQYKALLAIVDVPHPDRSIIGAFINDAVDPEEAAHSADSSNLTICFDDDAYLRKGWMMLLPYAYTIQVILGSRPIVSPLVFTDPELSEGTALSKMLNAFLSRNQLRKLRSIFSNPHCQLSERLDTIWSLSTPAFDAVKKGEVFVGVQTWGNNRDTTRIQTYNVDTNMFAPQNNARCFSLTDTIVLENRTPRLIPILNEELLGLNARFSKPFAWMETRKHMDISPNNATELGKSFSYSSMLPSPLSRFIKHLWIALPPFARAFVYDGLLWVGSRIYGASLSMTVHKLPFGLYLRRGSPVLAPKYHVEARTLGMVEQFTRIPAPRAIDVLETPRFAYLLMTCVPGRPIGQMLDAMTDEHVKQVVIDLKGYISELREIPSKAREFQICNSKGGGILDWRIPDSQRDELRFKTEAEFNRYLTDPFWEDIRRRAAKSHDIRHDIVFTHGDLNPRNILAENGRITGIVDWENAGWFPVYWEYTKAHSSVRSLMRWLADVVDRVFEGY